MEKTMKVRSWVSGVLTLIAEIVADGQRPDREMITEIRDLLQQIEEEKEET